LLLGEDWTEIVGISSSVVLIPLFGVDVPASSEGIRLGSEFTRTETDNEIELVEIFRPTGLPTGKHLRSSEILKIFVICDDVDRNRGTFEVMTPLPESFENSEEFLVMRVVIQLRGCEGARVESDGAELIVGAVEREDAGDGVVGGICFND
jgi:hypothetical protein